MENIPKIKIRYNGFLDPIFIFYVKNTKELENSPWKNWEPVGLEETFKKIKILRETWEKNGAQILKEMCNVSGLKFSRNTVDVHMVRGINRQFASPIVMYSELKPNVFVDKLTHELIHLLINDSLGDTGAKKLLQVVQEMFPEESELTCHHIPVYAIHSCIYKNVFDGGKNKILDDIERAKKYSTEEYTKAWAIVNDLGDVNIIKTLQNKTT